MPKLLKKAANLGPCCELVFHLWSNFSQWKMMKITYFTSIDDLSRDRTQDQWTTRQAIIPLYHEDKIVLSMKFCGFYSACARRENFGCIDTYELNNNKRIWRCQTLCFRDRTHRQMFVFKIIWVS